MTRFGRLVVGLMCLIAILVMLWIGRAPALRAAARWLNVGSPLQRADYVMILNGEEVTRPFTAAAIVKDGWAPRALIAAVLPSPDVLDGVRPPYEKVNESVLVKRGVDPRRIEILPGQAATTYDEATALAAFLKDWPSARVLVVTNDYHTRRARWAFHRALGDRAEQVRFIAAPTDEYNSERWWQEEGGVAIVASEFLKLGFYAACYGYVIQWIAACACLAIVIRWSRRRQLGGR